MTDRTPESTRDPGALALVIECEAFLAGRYHELLDPSRGQVPAWAWLNVLAHANVAELQEVVTGERWGAPERGCPRHWRAILAFMACELLDAAGDDAGLRALQRTCLVPLELMMNDATFADIGPVELAGIVLTALNRHLGPQDELDEPHP